LDRNCEHLIADWARCGHADLVAGRGEVLATPRTGEPDERGILTPRQNEGRWTEENSDRDCDHLIGA
jgi:hypothetical protein